MSTVSSCVNDTANYPKITSSGFLKATINKVNGYGKVLTLINQFLYLENIQVMWLDNLAEVDIDDHEEIFISLPCKNEKLKNGQYRLIVYNDFKVDYIMVSTLFSKPE